MIQTLKNRRHLSWSAWANLLGLAAAALLLLANALWPGTVTAALAAVLLAGFHAAALLLRRTDPAGDASAGRARTAPAAPPVFQAADRLARAAGAIREMTDQQSAGGAEQAAVIGQTQSLLDDVLNLSQQAQEQTRLLTAATRQAAETSEGGQLAIQQAIQGMNQIRTQVSAIAGTILALAQFTQRIDDIINSVGEIAIQSNLLALNASIEAARAGTHGRGFAVVADEVRSLSQQSTQAARQVRAILGEIQAAMKDTVRATEEGLKGVDTGVSITQEADALMVQLAERVSESHQAINQVYAITRQQVNALEEIAIGVERVDRIARRGAASAHSIEMTAQELERLAAELRGGSHPAVQQNADDQRKQHAGHADSQPQDDGAA